MTFKDRKEAAQLLAQKLERYVDLPDGIVLGLPRGGVVTAFEIARSLRLPLDIVVVRKIGFPGNEEFAIGAIDENGKGLFNENIIKQYQVSEHYLNQAILQEKREAKRRLEVYRKGLPPLDLQGKTVILADDGIATGFTVRAAIKSVRSKGAKRVILAIPVAPVDVINALKREVDEVVVLDIPTPFMAVGLFYDKFPQTTDEEVIDLLHRSDS